MRTLSAAALLAASLAVAGRADAQSCACPGLPDLAVVAPLEDSPLPVNGKLLLRTDLLDPKVFLNVPMGGEVATHSEPAGGDFAWLVLEEELNPASQYKITTTEGDLLRFNAWSGPDDMPPTLGSVGARVSRMSGDCFDVDALVLSLGGASDDQGLPLSVRLEIATPSSESVLFFPDRDATFISADFPSPCFIEAPDTKQGETYRATVTVYDRSGNASAPVGLDLLFPVPEEEDGCGCRMTPSSPRLPALMVLAALLVRRRRGAARHVSPARA